jgi:ATP-binding cassette subfamily B protein
MEQQPIRTMKTSTLLRRFAPYFRKYIPVLLFDLFCASLTTLCDIVLPLIVRSSTQLATTTWRR